MRLVVNLVYAVAVLALLWFFRPFGLVGVVATLPVMPFFERHRDAIAVSIFAAAALGGLVIPMAQLLGPEAIPRYAALSVAAAALAMALHYGRDRILGRA